MKSTRGCGRREFLKRAPLALAGAAAFPTIIKASALGRSGFVAPSDRIVMAGIGLGTGERIHAVPSTGVIVGQLYLLVAGSLVAARRAC